MKKFFYLFAILFLCQCSDKPCEKLNCGLNGTCNETSETCICNEYYEGKLCQNEIRERFLGTWTGTGVCNYNPNVPFLLTAEITEGIDIKTIKLQSANILQSFTITGELNDKNEIVIPDFKVNISSNIYNGKIINPDSNHIVITLNANVNGNISSCDYDLTK